MNRGLTIAAALLVAGGCSQVPKVEADPSAGRVDVDVERPGEQETWRGSLSAVGGSGVTGTATAREMGDATHATVSIRGARSGSVHPWHVHQGRCGDPNAPIVGPAGAYPPLNVGAGGTATAQAHVGAELNEASPYIVNVHRSPSDLTVIACGVIDD